MESDSDSDWVNDESPSSEEDADRPPFSPAASQDPPSDPPSTTNPFNEDQSFGALLSSEQPVCLRVLQLESIDLP